MGIFYIAFFIESSYYISREKGRRMRQIKTIKDLEKLIDRVHVAQNEYANFSEEQVESIFKAAAAAADRARIDLAELAVAETGMGIVEDKVIKNHFAAEYIYNKHKNTKTCGIISLCTSQDERE